MTLSNQWRNNKSEVGNCEDGANDDEDAALCDGVDAAGICQIKFRIETIWQILRVKSMEFVWSAAVMERAAKQDVSQPSRKSMETIGRRDRREFGCDQDNRASEHDCLLPWLPARE